MAAPEQSPVGRRSRRTVWLAVGAATLVVAAGVVVGIVTNRDPWRQGHPWARGHPCAEAATGDALPFRDLEHSANGANWVRPELTVARSHTELTTLWTRLHAGQQPVPPPPSIAWSHALAIGVTVGTRPTGGYRVEIERIVPSARGVEVCVVEYTPARGSAVSQALTLPYQLVEAPRFNGSAHLSIRKEAGTPD
ncbi:hypothetical protein GCM10020369_81780 [Cryptosporangium minutisporangium]|uniref:PrcB C-terminal domain-containing protein n=2 Tax=Cryptosporangium minutisporangium TaxID=113569 RepID=A0ABP6TCM2_9ACTN